MAVRFELCAHVGVVVNFAVEDHPDGAVLIRQRLLAGFQVDDAQPAMGERRMGVAMQPCLVGSAIGDAVAHSHRARRCVLVESFDSHDSSNAAHVQETAS